MDAIELVSLLTDSETTLFQRAYFDHRVEEEFKKSRRFGWKLSLLLIEVDGLDEIVSSSGDEGRRAALLNVSGTILTESRDVDLPARLDANQFAMLLPGTDAEGAGTMVQRVMTQILNDASGTLRLAVGITDAPRDGLETSGEFVARARQALETARAQGANQLVTWTAPA